MSGITESALRDLLDGGAVRSVSVVAQGDAWAVQVQIGTRSRTIGSKREDVRWWKSLDTAARWLNGLGVAEWSVDARQYAPAQRAC